MRTVTLAERPDLAGQVPALLATRWPAFMLEGEPGHDADLFTLLGGAFPERQTLLLDDNADGELAGVGLSLPISTGGTPPAGWDAVVDDAQAIAEGRRTRTGWSALSVTVARRMSGTGASAAIILAMKGDEPMYVPVRPVRKPRYPLVPLAGYAAWRTPDGQVFDPWLRLHLSLGARVAGVAEESLTIGGGVADWERWTGLAMPGDGAYVVPGALVPILVDTARDRGVYREPNLWVRHP